jgi:DNA-binding protein HU-beta
MYKAELIKTMLKKTEDHNVPLTARQMNAALSALLESVTDALKTGEKVIIPGFGTFGVKIRPARQGRNLFTGERIMIPARNVPGFKAGKRLKDAVAGT